jgi:2-polyprenyl-6-methoxyphenol hydroxylase-like FAD-dependent oxidoreductase
MHQDPWSGMGMDMAGVHATFLAEALMDCLSEKPTEQQALASYHEHRNAHGLESYRTTVRLGRDLRQLAEEQSNLTKE